VSGEINKETGGRGTYFDILRSMTKNPDVLAAVSEVEAKAAHTEWKRSVGWLGITHYWPRRLLGLWDRFMCSRNWHLFDEVCSGGPDGRHYLSCDACDLTVGIASASVPADSLEAS
jgi:hypothetical protein